MKVTPKQKALAVCAILTLAVIFASIFTVSSWTSSLPLVLFYALLIINSYFSIKLFANLIAPDNYIQNTFDIVLLALYIVMAFCIKSSLWFCLVVAFFFGITSLKYIHLSHTGFGHPRLLKRKTIANSLGALLGIACLGAILLGYPYLGAWSLLIFFSIANIFMFFVSPLYRLDTMIP